MADLKVSPRRKLFKPRSDIAGCSSYIEQRTEGNIRVSHIRVGVPFVLLEEEVLRI